MKPQTVGIESFANRLGLLSGVSYCTSQNKGVYSNMEAQQIFLFIDGVMYVVQEDPNDGYRSCMKDRILVADTMPINIWLPPEPVIGRHIAKYSDRYARTGTKEWYSCDRCDVMELWSTKTNLCVVEFGTDYSEDYYPSFVSAFHPQNLSHNRLHGEGVTADLLGESNEVQT